MGNEDVKKLVLARRAKFVAAALAGVAVACGGSTYGETNPEPCLSPREEDGGGGTDANADADPQPCLSPIPPDSGSDAGTDADAEPQPCLSPVPPDAGDGGE